MQTITNEQIYDRWEQVPESLKEAFFSSDNGEIIWKACEDAGLSEEIADNVLLVVGNIMLGFTSINEFANELLSISGMDQKAVDPIIFQIDQRIFEPVKADIMRLYREMAGTGPRTIIEAPADSVQSGFTVMRETEKIGTVDLKTPIVEAPHLIAKENDIDVDMRKIRIGEELQMPTPAPAEEKKEAPAQVEAPAIIHSEIKLMPVAKKGQALSSFGGIFGYRKGKKQESPVIPAEAGVVEGIGVRPQEIAKTEQRPVRIVHYTSAKIPDTMFDTSAQIQKDIPSFVPVTKQEHAVDFEPKMIDLASLKPSTEAGSAVLKPLVKEGIVAHAEQPTLSKAGTTVPVPAMPEEYSSIAPMPKMPEVVVMKTPQRVEQVAQPPRSGEPALADIPVSDDVVDLRTLERITNNRKPKTDNE